MKVFGDYDQAQLDAQYNLRARFPDHVEHLAAWARDGAAAVSEPGWRLDLAYGPTTGERLDFLPAVAVKNDRRTPLFIFFHGGYWQNLDKRDVAFLGRGFAEKGIAFAAPNYALAPMVSIDEIVRQARAAVAWLWRRAPGLGVDPGRIYIGGHSAGGHLAAMLAATAWPAQGGLPADLVKGTLSVSGIYDLAPLRVSYQQPVLKLDAGVIKRNSPLGLAPRTAGRIVAAVGDKEPEEFRRQQREFAAAWRKAGVRVETAAAPALHHFDILAKVADFTHPVGRAALALIRGVG
ncbi:MAG: alpha/beta hydrolase [Rhodospirillales bacterium]|nr:alpha/beta hydrolase [Rhodospirillales bacterium]